MPETLHMGLPWAALMAYAGAIGAAWWGLHPQGAATRWAGFAGAALAGALTLHTAALALRWLHLGHGPFTTLYEILSSNLWSLSLVFALAWWRWADVRVALAPAGLTLAVLGSWMLLADPRPGHLPPTYDTPLLYLHTIVGKLFLGLLLVSCALGAVPWLRRTAWGAAALAHAPSPARLDALAHAFAAFAFVFETLMLIVGAVWAQDAWGRYWAWDPLESWAFATWVALAAVLHARAWRRPSPDLHGLWLAGVFVIAFLTFFGVPYLSAAPHKGAI